jgi:hypothetical protein
MGLFYQPVGLELRPDPPLLKIQSANSFYVSMDLSLGHFKARRPSAAVLPDGLFSNQKIPIWVNFEGLRWENVYIFNGNLEYFTYRHLGYFMAFSYILCLFGTFFRFLVSCTMKIWQPWSADFAISSHYIILWKVWIRQKSFKIPSFAHSKGIFERCKHAYLKLPRVVILLSFNISIENI